MDYDCRPNEDSFCQVTMIPKQFFLYFLMIFFLSCKHDKSPVDIIQKTISSIDTVRTIFYQQTLFRGNTKDTNKAKPSERTFYYERLKPDSLIGAKAHIYFYDSSYIYHEDIYDGNRLIRKHNEDSSARIFDLLKYPDLRKKPFWGKTTPYVIQYMLNYALKNKEYYLFEKEIDTIVNGEDCYCVKTILEKKALMPGFSKFIEDTNRVETMILFISKRNFYPQRMVLETYFLDNPGDIYFTDHHFYNIKFNQQFDSLLFFTSDEVVRGFNVEEMMP